MKRLLVLFICLLICSPTLAQSGNGWRMYPYPMSSNHRNVHSISSDGAGGMWLGYQAHLDTQTNVGGLIRIVNGNATELLLNDTLRSCPSVDALAMAANKTVWLRLSGTYYSNLNNNWQTCKAGVLSSDNRVVHTLGSIDSTGNISMLSSDQLPNLAPSLENHSNHTLVTDATSRPWIGTANGVAVRNNDETWQEFTLWNSPTIALGIAEDQQTIIAAAYNGELATIASDGRVTTLPPLAETPIYLAMGRNSIWASTNGGVYYLNNQVWDRLNVALYALPITTKDDNLWVGYEDELIQYQGKTEVWRYTHQNSYVPFGKITALAWLNNTTLAIGSTLGVSSLDLTKNTFVNASREQQATQNLWQSTNRNAAGTWVWGPTLWAEQYEPYREAPNGARYVVYYDKTRMEVTQPDADSNNQWYITNGLLVQELVTGIAQYSDSVFGNGCPKQYPAGPDCRSAQRVVGDPENNTAPWYGEFFDYLSANGSRIGQQIPYTLLWDAQRQGHIVVEQAEYATPETTIVHFDTSTQHNIPQIFFSYLQQQPQDWLYMFGHPITDAHWTKATIGGQEKLVLIQLFERRTLSYTPDNPAEWRVEMGNVGQHYYQWRYDQTPWSQ